MKTKTRKKRTKKEKKRKITVMFHICISPSRVYYLKFCIYGTERLGAEQERRHKLGNVSWSCVAFLWWDHNNENK